MVKNLPSNAEDSGLIPAWGTKIPHAARQLSPGAAKYRSAHPGIQGPKLDREAHMPQRKIPHAAMKIPCAAAKAQHSQINKYFLLKKESDTFVLTFILGSWEVISKPW